jgi:small subunit ribosomal protein S1
MSGDRRTVRRRDQDEREERKPAAQAAPVAATTERMVAARAPHRPAAIPESAPAPKLGLSDLEAIAGMDPAEIAALMDGSTNKSRIKVGQKVTGVITRVGSDNVFVDLGAKSEAMLQRLDVPDAKPGDTITAFVLSSDEMGILLSQRLSGSAASELITEAKESGVPVEGKVTGRNSGGYEVRIGSVRAFCPVSQIDRHPDADPDKYVGNVYEFKIVDVRDGGDVVVSRRQLLDADIEQRRAAFWEKAELGQQMSGVVTSVQPFGVFVDMDGVEGLVPKRELAWDEEDAARFTKGTPINVRIVDLDRETRKITLSAKDQAASPWLRVGTDFVTGGVYEGTVVRLAEYGAFVEIAPGLQGLLHSSRAAGKKVAPGEKIQVRVGAVDKERQRIELSVPDLAERTADTTGSGAMTKGTVQQVLKNGIVVDLEDGNTGWLPLSNIDLPAGTVLAQRFRAGKELQARVVEFDPARRRVTLTLKEQADEGWRGQAQAAPQGLGTFADLLKGFKPRK